MSKVDISKFYHLADTLVMKLNLFTKPKVVVEGQSHRTVHVPALCAARFDVSPKVVSSFVCDNSMYLGLLIHIVGDLHIYMTEDLFDGMMTAHIVDRNKVGRPNLNNIFDSDKVQTSDDALETLMEGVVSSYAKHVDEALRHIDMKVPNNMDE